jgi:hypothetical protein
VSQFEHNKDRPNYLMIRYEDMVNNLHSAIKDICKFLDVLFEDAMLKWQNFTDHKGQQWQSNSSFDLSPGVTDQSVERWKTVLPAQEIEIIEYFCSSKMALLGYAASMPKCDLSRLEAFAENSSHISQWLRRYDFDLRKLT